MKRLSKRTARRLEDLGGRYSLAPEALSTLRELLEILEGADAPTTVHDPAAAVDVHIADSLTGLLVPALSDANRVADIGAGAGLPALVLAAARPRATFAAIESVGRKADFIRRAAGALGLVNVEVVAARVEAWPAGTGEHDVVCARALAALPVLVEYAAPLLRVGGSLVAWKGAVEERELADGRAAADATGLESAPILPVTPFPGSQRRTLHLYTKVAETPARFPRRAGMAAKRPISVKK